MKIRYLLLLVSIYAIIVFNPNKSILIKISGSEIEYTSKSGYYQVHEPIHIINDNDLRAKAKDENWDLEGTRDGSPTNPYMISNLSISQGEERLIQISDTSLYLNIENNILFGGEVGISLTDTNNVRISKNHIYNQSWAGILLQGWNSVITENLIEKCRDGVYLFGRENAHISENRLVRNGWAGIYIENFNEVVMERNHIYENAMGLAFGMYARNALAFDNDIFNNSQSGIVLADNFHINITQNRIHHNVRNGIQYEFAFDNSLINDNMIFENGLSGIEISWAANFKIMNNTITNHSQYGIAAIDDCHNLTIRLNRIVNSDKYGIYFSNFTSGNLVKQNSFFNNSRIETSQGYDSGNANLFTENYWNEWTLPNDDGDNYVDIPYRIDGEVENYDLYPLSSPIPISQGDNATTDDNSETIVIFLTSGFLVPNMLMFFLSIMILSRRKLPFIQNR